MYPIESFGAALRVRHWLRSALWRRVDRNVLLLGLTSFFTDISSEMVATILPLYIIYTLQLSPLQFGVVDGLYQGVAVLMRLAGGILSDRWQGHKTVTGIGYGISAICRLALLLTGTSWNAVAALVVSDRIGKGLRTAPRDALLALSARSAELATAFGVHRALDTAGAMIGPLVAFLLLGLVPGGFDVIFVVSFCFALIGLAVLILFVENRGADPAARATPCKAHHHAGHGPLRCPNCRQMPPILPGASLRSAIGLLRIPRFSALVASGSVLALASLSDGFVFLQLQRQLALESGFFPLLYVITSLVYMLCAIPAGRAADRLGRGRVFIAGYVLLLGVYLMLLVPELPRGVLACSLLLLGGYYAATDGVLSALASATLPAPLRASGLALLASAIGVARLCSSILFGVIWTSVGADAALFAFAVGLLIAAAVAALVLRLVPQVQYEF